MNSWKSTLLAAWAPPLRMFAHGTGSTYAPGPPRYRKRGSPAASAAALAAAMETPKIAFAPNRSLFSVPSARIIAMSSARPSVTSIPKTISASSSLTFSTALATPLPR
jgi:hypothetical protein